MTSNSTPKYIFWPKSIRDTGFLYGWEFEDGTCCVAGVLATNDYVEVVERLQRVSHRKLQKSSLYLEEVRVLGTCEVSHNGATVVPSQSGGLSVQLSNGAPQSQVPSTRFILYEPPDSRKLRFFSQKPLELGTTSYSLSEPDENETASTLGQFYEVKGVFPEPRDTGLDLEKVVCRLNTVKELQTELSKDRDKLGQHSMKKPSSEGRSLLRQGSQMLQRILSICLTVLNYPLAGHNSLRDISATAHQLDVRLRQAYIVPTSYQAIYRTSSPSSAASRAQYISFYNMLWLIANDVIIGSAVTAFCIDNNAAISHYLAGALKFWSVKGLQDTLLWLNDWPGGLKLNCEVGTFFCDAFLWFTAVWEGIFLDQFLLPNLPLIVTLVGFSATAGTTLFLALCSDLLSISTLHLYLFYSMATTVFSFHTSAMGSLFNIFRGKKRNVLRNRVEPSTYTLDQLLIGAILFTLAAFLLPTVLAFYLVFAASRCAIIAFHAGLEAILAFLNHFPLFAMMLRVKDSGRLPGGLAFSVLEKQNGPYLVMKNNPIPVSAIFHQYWALWSSFSQHYSPIYLLGKVVTGRYINPIPRSRLTFVSRNEGG